MILTIQLFLESNSSLSIIEEIVDNKYVKGRFMAHELLDKLIRTLSLDELQDYIKLMVKQRGFENQSSGDIMLLMLEEVGELAKAIRKQSGMKVDTQQLKNYESVSDELADVLIYVVVLANTCNINIFDALYAKELKNSKRTWVRLEP